MENLTFKQKYLSWVKRHKKKASKHTIIATSISLVLIILITILSNGDEIVAVEKDPETELTVTLMGDMMFGRYVEHAIEKKGHSYLFRYIRPYLEESDYITGNLESPIVLADEYKKADKTTHFRTGRDTAKLLSDMGFTTVNLANEHALDYGESGLADTLKVFEELGVRTVGAGLTRRDASKISYSEVNDYRIATLGFTDVVPAGFKATSDNPGVLTASPKTYMPLIEKANRNADMVVVHVHWGQEYDSGTHPRQREIAKAMVDAGADIIVGHQPHVLEPVEVYKGAVILYSLGNFIFDQGWSRTRESVLAQYKLTKDGNARVELIPVYIREASPKPLTGWEGMYRRNKIFLQLSKQTMKIEDPVRWDREGDKFMFELERPKGLEGDGSSGQ
ncbi:CapA family protein [Mechercharimyces sp. CAU 1602]|uniref:CapA family protein n=1 Tax=Mechercharimyces sp. CAU 1602 TaxID=2973933 RepID=UPI0021621A8D|nr:CapA family protein [Mechercharimyces sp. CAU 1602]MCS1350219.1 CapA family protein [Mechercharimyces sp. CAU 1602]